MSYIAVVNIIKGVCESINPNGLFVHTNKWEASLNFNEVNKQIFLYPLDVDEDMTNHDYESWVVVMGFYFQDAPDSNPTEQQALIQWADETTRLFSSAIAEYEGISNSAIRKESNYRKMAGTYTGMIIKFTLNSTTDLCA